MALRINTNVSAISAQRQLGRTQDELEHALTSIASGNRIVRPGDDAAGLAISETLRSQIAGSRQARSNAENAQSLIQVAEGGLNEQANILIRLRELGVQAASDTVTENERGFLNQEFTQLISEFDRIAQSTAFGAKKLLRGESQTYDFHVGPGGGGENIITYKLDADTRAGAMDISGLSISDRDDADDSLESIDKALVKIGGVRANFGAIQSRLQSAQNNLDIQNENLSAAKSRLSDADIAYETGIAAQAQVKQNAAIGVLAQANGLPERASRLFQLL